MHVEARGFHMREGGRGGIGGGGQTEQEATSLKEQAM